jgi:hypothetical protein
LRNFMGFRSREAACRGSPDRRRPYASTVSMAKPWAGEDGAVEPGGPHAGGG